MERDEILAAVIGIIGEVGVPDAVEEIDADTDLIECGVLDSFAKVEFTDAVWERFQLELSPADLFVGRVSVRSITNVMERMLK